MPLIACPPQSNAERQRRFRERNPGYYARIQAANRAATKRGVELFRQQMQAAAVAVETVREPLLLPAPVEAVELSGWPWEVVRQAKGAAVREAELLPAESLPVELLPAQSLPLESLHIRRADAA